jgi:hypothetical protein
MIVILRSIKYSATLSSNSNAFTGDVWVNQKKIAFAKNNGRGGNTDIKAYKGYEDKLTETFEFAKTLPMVGGLVMDLSLLIDLQVEDYLRGKFKREAEAEVKRKMLTSIVYKDKEGEIYHIKFNKFTIKQMLAIGSGRKAIKTLVDKLQSEGATIKNTNIDIILN